MIMEQQNGNRKMIIFPKPVRMPPEPKHIMAVRREIFLIENFKHLLKRNATGAVGDRNSSISKKTRKRWLERSDKRWFQLHNYLNTYIHHKKLWRCL